MDLDLSSITSFILSFDTIEPSLNFDPSVSLPSVTIKTLRAGTYIKSI